MGFSRSDGFSRRAFPVLIPVIAHAEEPSRVDTRGYDLGREKSLRDSLVLGSGWAPSSFCRGPSH